MLPTRTSQHVDSVLFSDYNSCQVLCAQPVEGDCSKLDRNRLKLLVKCLTTLISASFCMVLSSLFGSLDHWILDLDAKMRITICRSGNSDDPSNASERIRYLAGPQ